MNRLAPALVLAAFAAHAAPVATDLTLLDADAQPLSASVAGAVLAVTLGDSADAPPLLVADGAAPGWSHLSGLARLSDGRHVVSDLGPSAALAQDGRLFTIDPAGVATLLSADARLREPVDVTELAAGVLAVADRAADPSGLGLDSQGTDGHGALFAHEAGALRVVADGTRHAVPGVTAGTSVFEDPVAVARDPATGGTLVLDFNAAIPGSAGWGALFLVDATGFVTLLSAHEDFYDLVDVATLSDGTILVLDGERGNSRLYRIDRGAADLTRNATLVSHGAQHAKLEGLAVGPRDAIFVVDSGEVDAVSGALRRAPSLSRIEPLLPARQNADVVHQGAQLLLPLQLAVESRDVSEGLAVSVATPLSAGMAGVRALLAPARAVAPWSFEPAVVGPGALGAASVTASASRVPSLRLVQHSADVSDMRLSRETGALLAR